MTGSENKKEEDLEKERNKIIQDKIKKLESELKKEKQKRQDLENKIEKIKPNTNNLSNNTKTSKGISRRQFLKKAGLGTAGLAALMSPVSSLDVRSDSFGVFTEENQDNPYFSVGQGGPVNIRNTYLDLNNQGIRNVGVLELPRSEASSDHGIWLDTAEERLKVKIGGNIYQAEIQNTAIPDSEVWQSYDDTVALFEDSAIHASDDGLDGREYSDEQIVEEVIERTNSGYERTDFDGTETQSLGHSDISVIDYDDQFWFLSDSVTSSSSIDIRFEYDLSSSDTIDARFGSLSNSSTLRCFVAVTDVGGIKPNAYEVRGDSSPSNMTIDISGLSGTKEIHLGYGSSSDYSARFTDLAIE